MATARGDAATSGRVVQDAVVAMGAIEKSAADISQIIGVIDEIAFQTNLLALNAGVEAARGRGGGSRLRGGGLRGARALAQRSAQAAKEIKGLISTSSKPGGVRASRWSARPARPWRGSLAQVSEISGIVTEIAASAQEQATGLQEINTAVNQMDQSTQQNAALVEQSTEASHALAQEAEQLATLLGQFRLRTNDAARPVHPVVATSRASAVRTRKAPARVDGNLALAAGPTQPDGWEEF